jgi:hypothetical protein
MTTRIAKHGQKLKNRMASVQPHRPVSENEDLTAKIICRECGKLLGLSKTGIDFSGICAQCFAKRGGY